MAPGLTQSDALARKRSVLRAETDKARRRLAAQFEREVERAIAAGECTNPTYCKRLVAAMWAEVKKRTKEA
jgi:hypothetical protein